MNDLTIRLREWLEEGGKARLDAIENEVSNRAAYPKIREALLARPIDMMRLQELVAGLPLLNQHLAAKRATLEAFTQDPASRTLVEQLIDDMPDDREAASAYITQFVQTVGESSYAAYEGVRDFAGAATLTSLILTIAYPERFVDYPSTKRWQQFAETLSIQPPELETYGERLTWYSELACLLGESLQHLGLANNAQYPLWSVGGLCWASGFASDEEPADPDEEIKAEIEALSLSNLYEAARKATSTQATVKEIKTNYYRRSYAIKVYALTRAEGYCEGCGEPAPFISKTGKPYLEVHHLDRVADNGPDAPDAVGALCPTCHTRIHHGQDGDEYNEQVRKQIQEKERRLGH